MKNKNNKIQIISELHPQHSGSMSLLKQMALLSFMGGTSSVKLQLYSSKDIPNGKKKEYLIFNNDEVLEIKDYCDLLSIDLFFSAFNLEKLNFLKKINFNKIKIASRSQNDNKLVNFCIDNFEEVIVSTNSLTKAKKFKKYKNVRVLYCVSQYPTFLEDINLPKKFDIFDGFSDHTIGKSASILAITRGAKIIEKHFTISQSLQKDLEKAHICSMDYSQLLEIKKFTLDYQIMK